MKDNKVDQSPHSCTVFETITAHLLAAQLFRRVFVLFWRYVFIKVINMHNDNRLLICGL